MPFVAARPERWQGQVVGRGQCVDFVRIAADVPHTSLWVRGDPVPTTDVPTGTAIATFDADGRYGNHTDGRSHAALFVRQMGAGMQVWDCWLEHPVAQRVIQCRDGVG
jgi:hypothetical protein